MKKMFCLILIGLLAFPVAAADKGSLVKIYSGHGTIETAADSAKEEFDNIFDIPDGIRGDTLIANFWAYSAEGSVDWDISKFYGMKVGRGDFKWRSDSSLVVSTHTTESAMKAYLVVAGAEDTLSGGHSGKKFQPDAINIRVLGGGSNNGSDSEWYMEVMGYKDDDK
jgi:hypothetical protein